MNYSIVYVLTNAAMPGIVKIGKTGGDINFRMGQLYTTGVPFPFELQFACRVLNADEVEQALQQAFLPNRINSKREFFKIEPEQAIAILKLLHVEEIQSIQDSTEISPEEFEAAINYKSRRPNLNFSEMGIPIGSILNFIENEVSVRVVSDRKIDFNGGIVSLTSATRSLLGLDYSIQPSPKWTFNGRLLSEIYNETYNNQ